MKRKLRNLFRLPAEERRILGQAWVLLLVAYLAARFLPLPKAQRLLVSKNRAARPSNLAAKRMAELVDRAARHHFYPMHCLPKALALQSLLSRERLEAELRIGVRREGNVLLAHAWLEQAGQPIGEGPEMERAFLPLAAPGARS